MRTPFKAESVESLRVRYPAALVRVWTMDPMDAPDRRPNLFDFANGTRLVISRDVLPRADRGGEPWRAFHLSASFVRNSATWNEIATAYEIAGVEGAKGRMKDHVVSLFAQLDPDRAGRLEFVGWFTRSSVPHWVIWEAKHDPA